MLKNNYKFIFHLALTPVYISAMFILWLVLGSLRDLQYAGGVNNIISIMIMVIAAWLLSYKKNILLNIIGAIYFFYVGWNSFSIIFNPQPLTIGTMYDTNIISILYGIFILSSTIIALIYVIIKYKKIKVLFNR